jgi:hypothetical protein
VLGQPLEELLDLWAQTDWAQVDCRLQGHGRPGSRLSAPDAVRSSGAGPMNVKSTDRPNNPPLHLRRPRSARAPPHLIRPPTRRRLRVLTRAAAVLTIRNWRATRRTGTRPLFLSEFCGGPVARAIYPGQSVKPCDKKGVAP